VNIGGDYEIGRSVRRCVCLSVYTNAQPAGTVAPSCENFSDELTVFQIVAQKVSARAGVLHCFGLRLLFFYFYFKYLEWLVL